MIIVLRLILIIGVVANLIDQGSVAQPINDASVVETPDQPASLAEKEKRFEESMTGVVLVGIWQVTGKDGLKGSDPLSEPKKETYTIDSVSKAAGDNWVINARIQFGSYDVTIPVLVRVVFADDTPVITLNDMAIPPIGTYSARVMIHNGFYSGVWYSNAKNYGGVMTGRVVKREAAKRPKTIPKSNTGGE